MKSLAACLRDRLFLLFLLRESEPSPLQAKLLW
jgi:hypothetical protein